MGWEVPLDVPGQVGPPLKRKLTLSWEAGREASGSPQLSLWLSWPRLPWQQLP